MGYRPQFQHKNGRPQGPAEALGLGNGGGGLTVINSLSSLGLSIKADKGCDRAQDGTIRS
jgi:hypothetical protein